jgi:hypothetical protein
VDNVSKKTMKRAMRIGLAAVSALLALQVTTGKAFASVEIFTVDSLTRQGTSQITVSGTVQFSAGDLGPQVYGEVVQFQRGQVPAGISTWSLSSPIPAPQTGPFNCGP